MQYEEIKALLSSVEGCTFAALDTVTVPALSGGKANPFKGKVAKHCLGHRVMLFTNQKSNAYLNKVRRHLEREGKNPDSFELSPRRWGERIPNSPFVQHNGKHYLECVFLEAGESEYRALESFTFPTGDKLQEHTTQPDEIIPKDYIIGLPDKSGSEHQGLDDQVIVRTYAIESIVAIRAMGSELQ